MGWSSETGAVHRWHEALAYAVTGRRWPDLPEPEDPDVRLLSRVLQTSPGRAFVAEHARQTAAAGAPWPHPVPADLMQGLGPAQFAAALAQLQTELDVGPATGAQARVGREQAVSAADRRLLDDVPPHHGG